MNKICPKCKQNFSMAFDECVYCGEKLVVQENMQEIEDLSGSNDIVSMTDQEILTTYKSYKETLVEQGICTSDEDFIQGIRKGNYNKRMSVIKLEKERMGQIGNTPKCPICQSTNLSKISNLKKAGKIGLFGIFGAGDIGKTWKCNNCGSKF